jgi:hypothetical protein
MYKCVYDVYTVAHPTVYETSPCRNDRKRTAAKTMYSDDFVAILMTILTDLLLLFHSFIFVSLSLSYSFIHAHRVP